LIKHLTTIKPKQKKSTWLLVLGAIFAASFIFFFYFYTNTKDNMEDEIDKFPVVKLLLGRHPEIREQFVQDLRVIKNKGSDLEAAETRINQLMQTYVDQYVAQASDESVMEFANQFLLIVDEIKTQHLESCPAFINRQGNRAVRIVRMFNRKIMVDTMGKVIETSIKNPQPKPDPVWAGERLRYVMDTIYATNDPNFTINFSDPTMPPDKVCYSIKLIFKTIQETLLAQEVGPVLRHFLAPQ